MHRCKGTSQWPIVFLAAAVAILSACRGFSESAATQGQGQAAASQLQVIATTSIIADLAQNVGWEHIHLRTLVGPDSDAHTFEPSPADSAALAEASLILENGLAFEPWLDELYESSGSTAGRVVVTKGLELLAAEGEHEEEEADEHEHGEFDPHVWHSVANAIQIVRAIRDALAAADPTHAAAYQAHAEAYIAQLQELDAWVFAQVESLPAERRKLVTSHDSFSYFAGRYGFEIAGTAFGSISTEVADPSAGEIAALVEAVKAAGVPVIFAENIANADLMEQIAAEAGVALGPTLYTDALGPAGSEGDTYLKMVGYNVTTIVTALRGGE